MATDERAVAQACHRLGTAIESLGRRMMTVANDQLGTGRELRRVKAGDLADGKLHSIRRPLDAFRAAIDKHAAITSELRAIGDALAEAIGVPDEN